MASYRVVSVVSANGAGHFRRSIGILHRLVAAHPSLELTVFCTSRQLEAMRSWRQLEQLTIAGTRFITEVECGLRWPINPTDTDLLAWRDKLPKLADFQSADVVLSDNLAGVLALRSDAVLAGSFLWSDVLVNEEQPNVRAFVEDEAAWLRSCRPSMLCVGAIATPTVLTETEAVQLPWMCEQAASEPRILARAPRIGICGGTTNAATDIVAHLARTLAPRFDVIVDSAAGSAVLPSSVRRGLLRDIPLDDVDVVLCRPGAGTVMDCVAANIPFLTFVEPDSPEMAYNAKRLQESGTAENLTHPLSEESVLQTLVRVTSAGSYRAASENLHALPKDGLNQAAMWLAARLEGSTR